MPADEACRVVRTAPAPRCAASASDMESSSTLWQRFKLRVPIRDMRLVDPNLLTSETGKILVRDNAIVFSVEHVRIIITGDQVGHPES